MPKKTQRGSEHRRLVYGSTENRAQKRTITATVTFDVAKKGKANRAKEKKHGERTSFCLERRKDKDRTAGNMKPKMW